MPRQLPSTRWCHTRCPLPATAGICRSFFSVFFSKADLCPKVVQGFRRSRRASASVLTLRAHFRRVEPRPPIFCPADSRQMVRRKPYKDLRSCELGREFRLRPGSMRAKLALENHSSIYFRMVAKQLSLEKWQLRTGRMQTLYSVVLPEGLKWSTISCPRNLHIAVSGNSKHNRRKLF